MTQELLCDIDNGHATLTFNRPERRNALSPSLVDAVLAQLAQLAENPEVRVVSIKGAGDRSFCAGADLQATLSSGITPEVANQKFAQMLEALLSFPKPLIAHINGHCMGGGVGVALACDIAIAQDNAKIGTPEVKVGLFPFMISTLILRQMPRKRAMQMMLCGERLSADEALRYNLLNQVVPADQLDQAVATMVESLLAAAPLAQQFGKQALYDCADTPFPEAVRTLGSKLTELTKTQDAVEGITAFIEKRPPVWKGQ